MEGAVSGRACTWKLETRPSQASSFPLPSRSRRISSHTVGAADSRTKPSRMAALRHASPSLVFPPSPSPHSFIPTTPSLLHPLHRPQGTHASHSAHTPRTPSPLSSPPLHSSPFLSLLHPGPPSPSSSAVASSPAQQAQVRAAETDVMGLLLRQRIIFLGSEMNDLVADAVVSQLLLLDAQDPNRDIRLFINSPGGSISSTMAIFDALNLCRADVSTIAFGLAASTAAIVLAAGTRGKRYAMPNTRIMMHQPMGGASGQAIDVEIQAKEIMFHKNNVTRIISEITGRPFAKVEKDIDRDRYMSPMEAVEYGLIDGVIDEDAIIPLQPSPERVKPRREHLEADKDPRKFLIPTIPDSEIY